MRGQPFDLFPAVLRTPDEVSRGVRVVVADDRLRVYGAARANSTGRTARGVAVLHDLALADVKPDAGDVRTLTLQFEDGTTWTARREGSCACGNPLKKMTLGQLASL